VTSKPASKFTFYFKETEVSQELQDVKQAVEQLNGAPGSRPLANAVLRPFLAQIARYWWVELGLGALWLVAAVVVLKFNNASVTTVGVLTGIMFLFFAAEEFALATLDRSTRWLWALFGVLLTAAGVVALIHPRNTFAGFADILGFVFLLIGFAWTWQAFAERVFNSLWWLSLISGMLMIVLAFWVSGEFFLQRAATLLVFAGVWALMKGITDVVRAFQIRGLASS
jgi:uncharacterized membrane protein HdeD (DUF308 family)